MSNRLVTPGRVIAPFYEAGGDFGVSKEHASLAFDTAVTILAKYLCTIATESIRGARLTLPDNPLSIQKIRLGNAAHTFLFTSRDMRGSSADAKGTFTGEAEGRRVVNSRSAVTVENGNGRLVDPTKQFEITVGRTVHELAHNFYADSADHCTSGQDCIMEPNPTHKFGKLLSSGEPFCNPCANELEIAGFMATAQRQ